MFFFLAPPLQGRGWGGAYQHAPGPCDYCPTPNPSPEGEGFKRAYASAAIFWALATTSSMPPTM
ncbi:hypothetical protein FPZ54_08220 [Sphingomonas suaedae]|uniref:Uncharacterized protein n=1 Tax=Sphingomonas suaedae TaxID=2599297 RepID=A0A518REY9_9SPHN|nr:hypothetical protein FPZ54_08220 [Sphingomonas suaedae]